MENSRKWTAASLSAIAGPWSQLQLSWIEVMECTSWLYASPTFYETFDKAVANSAEFYGYHSGHKSQI